MMIPEQTQAMSKLEVTAASLSAQVKLSNCTMQWLFILFFLAGKVTCQTPGNTCIAMGLHISSKVIWPESSQAGSRSDELPLEVFHSPVASPAEYWM